MSRCVVKTASLADRLHGEQLIAHASGDRQIRSNAHHAGHMLQQHIQAHRADQPKVSAEGQPLIILGGNAPIFLGSTGQHRVVPDS